MKNSHFGIPHHNFKELVILLRSLCVERVCLSECPPEPTILHIDITSLSHAFAALGDDYIIGYARGRIINFPTKSSVFQLKFSAENSLAVISVLVYDAT